MQKQILINKSTGQEDDCRNHRRSTSGRVGVGCRVIGLLGLLGPDITLQLYNYNNN